MGDHLLDKHQLPPRCSQEEKAASLLGQCHEKWLGSVRQEELQATSAEGSWDRGRVGLERGA